MEHCEGEFTGERGVRIYYQAWRPEAPKGVVAITHGLGEHSGRYQNVVGALVPRGYAVYALDFCGHGRSGGPRGHVHRFADYLADLDRLIDKARRAEPDLPVFLLGHSLGGLIALAYALERPGALQGVIGSAPGLRRRFEVPGYKLLLGRLMSGIWPTFSQRTGLPVDRLSHDPQVALAYVADRLVHDRATARWLIEFTRASEDVMARAGSLTMPCLLLQSGDDALIEQQSTIDFYNAIGAADRTLHVYDGFYHELFNEVGKERPLADLVAWLDTHLSGQQG